MRRERSDGAALLALNPEVGAVDDEWSLEEEKSRSPDDGKPWFVEGYSQMTGRAVQSVLSGLPFSGELKCRYGTFGALSRRWQSCFCVVYEGDPSSLLLFARPVDFVDYARNPYLDATLRSALVRARVKLTRHVAAGPVHTKLYKDQGLLAHFRLSRHRVTLLKIGGPEHFVRRLRDLVTLEAATHLNGGKGRPPPRTSSFQQQHREMTRG